MAVGIPPNAMPWQYNNAASGALTGETVLAAVLGKRVYVTHILFNTVPGGTFALGGGGTMKFGTVTLGANGLLVVDRSANPLFMGQGLTTHFTTTGAGVACIHLAGFTV